MIRTVSAIRASSIILLFLFLPAPPVFPQGAGEAAAPPASAAPPAPYALKGSFSAKYVYRSSRTEELRFSDQDLFEELRFTASMTGNDTYAFHFLGTGRQDVDGDREPRTFSPLEDIGDAGNHNAKTTIYEARIDINRPSGPIRQVRLGRQTGTRDAPVFFDGAALDLAASQVLQMTLYGGSAVHYNELFRDAGDDFVAGAGIDVQALRSTLFSIDYLTAQDEQTYPAPGDRRDNQLALKLVHRFSPAVRTMAKYRFLSGDPRDFSLRAAALYAPADIEVSANYFRQFAVQNELANEFSFYYDIIGRSNPYETYDVKLRKFFGERYAVDLGYYGRDLTEKRSESEFNRRFSRSYAVLEVMEMFLPGLSLSITGEAWHSWERAFRTWGGDLSYAFPAGAKKATIGAGSYFSLYKYDYYAERGERTRARTYYVNTRYPLRADLWLNAAYEYEQAIEEYQTVKLGMRHDF